MTTEEFSDAFDVMLNSMGMEMGWGEAGENASFSLNEYEKSVYLTKAQQDVVRGLYDGSMTGRAFEQTEQLRSALQGLVRTATPEQVTGYCGLSDNSVFYKLPADVWYITYEQAVLSDGGYCNGEAAEVVPVRQDQWHKTRRNPFRRPSERRVARMDNGQGVVELISSGTIGTYTVRYLRKPKPIILEDIEDPVLSIDGRTEVTECELGVMLHRPILDRAVQLASARFITNNEKR